MYQYKLVSCIVTNASHSFVYVVWLIPYLLGSTEGE